MVHASDQIHMQVTKTRTFICFQSKKGIFEFLACLRIITRSSCYIWKIRFKLCANGWDFIC